MQWTNLAAIGIGTAGAVVAVATARSGVNYSDTHDLRRRPAPSTVWNSMGKILVPQLGGVAMLAGAGKLSSPVASAFVGAAGFGLAFGGIAGAIWGMSDDVKSSRSERKLAPGYG